MPPSGRPRRSGRDGRAEMLRESGAAQGAITFSRPPAFWLGIAACVAGVALHLPMYVGARDRGFRLAGMQPDPPMLAGMALVVIGLAAATRGPLPTASDPRHPRAARASGRAA